MSATFLSVVWARSERSTSACTHTALRARFECIWAQYECDVSTMIALMSAVWARYKRDFGLALFFHFARLIYNVMFLTYFQKFHKYCVYFEQGSKWTMKTIKNKIMKSGIWSNLQFWCELNHEIREMWQKQNYRNTTILTKSDDWIDNYNWVTKTSKQRVGQKFKINL